MFINDLVLRKTATINNTLLISALWLVMAFFVMPEAMRQLSVQTSGARGTSASLLQSPIVFYEAIGMYGEKGRQHFIAIELTADVFYAIVTSLLLGFLLLWSFYFSKNRHLKAGHLIWLASLVLLSGLLKNVGMVALLMTYPATCQWLYYLTGIFSFCKTAAVVVSLGTVAWNLVIWCRCEQRIGP